MKRYIALLRGINIGGKNKIDMSKLKEAFAELGFTDITTYLNSGNVIFSSVIDDKNVLSNKVKRIIKELLINAPDWWGDSNKEIYDNIIFLLPPLSYEEFFDEIGKPKAEYEKVHNYKNVIFWSFSRKDYQKTNWWSKTASANVKDKITIRTANTVRKIVGL